MADATGMFIATRDVQTVTAPRPIILGGDGMKVLVRFTRRSAWTSILVILLHGAVSSPAQAQLLCEGDFVLETQSDVSDFGTLACTEVDGSLTIGPEDYVEFPEDDHREDPIMDLTPLAELTIVHGSLIIRHNSFLPELTGLGELTTVGGNLSISRNAGLLSLQGLEKLSAVEGGLLISDNSSIWEIDALQSLKRVGSYLSIERNPALAWISELINVTEVGGPVKVVGNTSLSDCCGLTYMLGALSVSVLLEDNGSGCSETREIMGCDVHLTSQSDVDAFAYRRLFGSLHITSSVPGDPVRDLTPLSILNVMDTETYGLFIENNPELTSLNGLHFLAPPLTFSVRNAPKLTSLEGVPKSYYVWIEGVPLVETATISPRIGVSIHDTGLRHLELEMAGGTGEIEIVGNPSLISITGLEDLSRADGLTIEANASLHSLPALPFLEDVGELIIAKNASLRTLSGLESLSRVEYRMDIRDNASLIECSCGLAGLISDGAFEGVEGEVTIRNNAPGGTCNSVPMVLETPCVPYEACDDILTLPRWDGHIHSNGNGTGWMRITAPTGLARANFYNTTNLSTDLSAAGFISNAFNDWTWAGPAAAPPVDVTVHLETINKASGKISFWVRLHDSCRRTVDIDPMTDLGEDVSIPTTFALEQNYPNPFNPSTTVIYVVPEEARIVIGVYDHLGREVRRLVDGVVEPGRHEVKWQADGYPSGIYVLRMQSGDLAITRQVVMIR